jgi:hypothetical protein
MVLFPSKMKYFYYTEGTEKNAWKPDFDSNLTGIGEAQNLPKTRTSELQSAGRRRNTAFDRSAIKRLKRVYLQMRHAVQILDSPPAGECIKTLEAFR